MNLDSGCNGLIFIQMHKRPGSPSPTCMLEHMLTKAASTRKHMSRLIQFFVIFKSVNTSDAKGRFFS